VSVPTLYFVRHGETDWNAEARLQGQQDVPLNAFGRVQAEEAGARLRALAPGYANLDYVASPLSRTRETMGCCAGRSASTPLCIAPTIASRSFPSAPEKG
jgi:broad specificity phosphatase PhoE